MVRHAREGGREERLGAPEGRREGRERHLADQATAVEVMGMVQRETEDAGRRQRWLRAGVQVGIVRSRHEGVKSHCGRRVGGVPVGHAELREGH